MGAFQVSLLAAQVLATWLLTTAASAYTVYVTNEKDNTVSIIDSTKLEVIKTVKVGQRPRGVILSKDGNWLLICASDDNHIQVFDARTLEFVKTLPSGWSISRPARCWQKFRSVWSLRGWVSPRTGNCW